MLENGVPGSDPRCFLRPDLALYIFEKISASCIYGLYPESFPEDPECNTGAFEGISDSKKAEEKMKELKVCKADPIGETEVQPVTIVINGTLPEIQLDEVELAYNLDAQALANALFYSLPQGTFDRLIIKLMKRKTSIYRGITKS